MSLPKKPLEFKTDVQDLTVAQLRLLTEPTYNVMELNRFVIEHTTWGQVEMDEVALKEMDEVRRRVGNLVTDKMRPLSPATPSAPGPDSKKTKKDKS